MLTNIKNYLSLVKFAHTIFAMPFALIGFFLAVKMEQSELKFILLLYIILCMVFARNAAMGFNRFLDRQIDKKNPRTAQREIPAGIITEKNALAFIIINSALFLFTTYLINNLVFFLSPVALLVILGYSYTKRFTSLAHFVLGLGLALAPIGAFLSVAGKFAWIPVLLSFVVLFWVSGFDILYALQDENFDKSEKLHSIPVLLGRKGAMKLSVFVHFLSGVLVVFVGFLLHAGVLYWIGSVFFSGFLIYQHILVKPNDISKLNLAFFTLNGIASVIFALFTISDLLLF